MTFVALILFSVLLLKVEDTAETGDTETGVTATGASEVETGTSVVAAADTGVEDIHQEATERTGRSL